MQKALLYKKIKSGAVQCRLCNHFCKIENACLGFCCTRKNIDGDLYVLNYNKLIAKNVDPIEKKPLFHYMPSSLTYSIACMGCNLACSNCQNWQISQINKIEKLDEEFPGENIEPCDIINLAKKENCPTIAYTYSEPTIFLETALPIMKLAHTSGLKNIWVSNGFMSKECLDLICPYLDAINIDLKFFSEAKYKKITNASLKPILDNLKYLKSKKIFIEITTLLIPGETNTNKQLEKIAKFIYTNIGKNTPWHISAFSPEISFKLLSKKSSSMKELESAYQIGKNAGLEFVYLGNIASDTRENTYCPACGFLNIERQGYIITRDDNSGLCQNCKYNLNII